jgi:NADPH:quinone reductase-like Zn-dependent oxidoreductase
VLVAFSRRVVGWSIDASPTAALVTNARGIAIDTRLEKATSTGTDLVFDVIGGDIQKRSTSLIRAGGRLVTIAGPPEARPADGLAIDFVVESDGAQLGEIALAGA